MTVNNSSSETDAAATSPAADSPETGAVRAQTLSGTPMESPPETSMGDETDELAELLTRLDSPELVSIRRLFNMC